MNEDEVQKAYDIIHDALEDADFQRWLNTDSVKDDLGVDYDEYATHMMDNDQEPMGYNIWALRRYLAREENEKDADDDENLTAEETLSGIQVIKLKDGKDVAKLHDAIEKALGE